VRTPDWSGSGVVVDFIESADLPCSFSCYMSPRERFDRKRRGSLRAFFLACVK